jgi:hypothetical protein
MEGERKHLNLMVNGRGGEKNHFSLKKISSTPSPPNLGFHFLT